MKYQLEVGARTVDDVVAAWQGGAQRVELYVSPNEGALTPSAGLVKAAVAAKARQGMDLGLYAMLRPRAGDSYYSDSEFAILKEDAAMLHELGAEGFMCGVITAEGQLDSRRMQEVMALCPGKPFTLHRAFESVCDPFRTLEEAIDLGIRHVFIGGAAPYGRWDGALLPRLLAQAAGRITVVMAIGPSFRNADLPEIVRRSGVSDYHIINSFRPGSSRLTACYGSIGRTPEEMRAALGSRDYLDAGAVRELRDILDQFE